jgi:hypothetical protein
MPQQMHCKQDQKHRSHLHTACVQQRRLVMRVRPVPQKYIELTMLDTQVLNSKCKNRDGTVVVKMELANEIDSVNCGIIGTGLSIPGYRALVVEMQPTLRYFDEQIFLRVWTPL